MELELFSTKIDENYISDSVSFAVVYWYSYVYQYRLCQHVHSRFLIWKLAKNRIHGADIYVPMCHPTLTCAPPPPSLAPRPPPTPPQQSTCLHITVLPSRALGLNCIESVCFCCCRVPKRGSRAARKLCSARLSPLWLRAHSPPASDTCRDVRTEYASTRRVASR